MDKELIWRLAGEAGFGAPGGRHYGAIYRPAETAAIDDISDHMQRFAALIAEECAKVAEPVPLTFEAAQMGVQQHDPAAAIRERFKP